MRSPLILNPSLGMEMMQIYRSMQVAFGVSTGVAAVVSVGAWGVQLLEAWEVRK